MHKLVKGIVLTIILLVGWYGLVKGLNIPHYLLLLPSDVWHSLNTQYALLWQHTQVTFIEIAVGLVLGVLFGLLSALVLSFSASLRALLLPLLIVSQAIPVFAIAPLLVLWLGYGMASKIAMTVLIIYFPITSACYDGLCNTPKAYLELAKNMVLSEIDLHIHYCKQWGISEQELAQLQESNACIAYNRYVLDCGMLGDLAELYAALAPCPIGYAVIGRHIQDN